MNSQTHTQVLEIPERGAPSDWHLFPAGAHKPATGDVALCGYVLQGNVGHYDPSACRGGSDRVLWCPLCAHLGLVLKELKR